MQCQKSAEPAHLAVRYAAFTHRGTPHRHNQDAILTAGRVIQKAEFVDGVLPLDRRQRFAVSDGVSSQPHPAAASRLLLETLLALDRSHPELPPPRRAETLHDRLLRALDRQPQLEDAAATLITAEVSGDTIRLWHAGDSRGYRITPRTAIRLTQDHTLLNMLIAAGQLTSEQAEPLQDTSLARALDTLFIYSHDAEPPIVGVHTVVLEPGQVLLLVSDGVTSELADEDIAALIAAEDLAGSAHRLFDAVMANGAPDDLSAVLLAFESA